MAEASLVRFFEYIEKKQVQVVNGVVGGITATSDLPLVISDPTYEVPAGRQIIFDTLEVSAATTLTISGRMCVRDGLENGGVIENNGVLKLG